MTAITEPRDEMCATRFFPGTGAHLSPEDTFSGLTANCNMHKACTELNT